MDLSDATSTASKVSFERGRGVSGLTVIRDVAHLLVQTGNESDRTDKILQVLSSLASVNVPIFLVKLHRTHVTMALAGTDLQRAHDALQTTGLPVTARRDLALVAVRAASMRDLHGVI